MLGLKDRLLRYWTYFRRGHSVYLVFAISFLNFVVVQYYILIERIPFLKGIFTHFHIFTILFILGYLPFAVVIGWVDYKRMAFPVDSAISAKANPWTRDMSRAIILLAEGKRDEVIELMKKWVE